MQTIYIYTTLGYIVASSYKFERRHSTDQSELRAEAEQKVCMALLGYGIGKFVFCFVYDNVIINLPKFLCYCVTGGGCIIALLVHTIVAATSKDKYNAGWFFSALTLGIQDAVIAGKFEINLVNPITEGNEGNLDSNMIGRILGVLIIGFAGLGARDSNPVGLMIPLIIFFSGAFGLSFFNLKEDSEGSGAASGGDSKDKMLLEAADPPRLNESGKRVYK